MTGDAVLTAALTDINGLYDNFMNSLLQVNASTGVSGSASVIQGYQLAMLLKGVTEAKESTAKDSSKPEEKACGTYSNQVQRPAFVLLASVVSAGGTERVHKTLWTALSIGDKITYSGGAVVNVSLWRADSTSPIYVDVLRYRTPFYRMKDPSNVDGVDSGDNLNK